MKKGDLSLEEVWTAVNTAAYSLEEVARKANNSYTKKHIAFLIKLGSDMRRQTEDNLGSQPGFSRRRVIPKY